MSEGIYTEDYRGYAIRVVNDDDPMDPITDWDTLGSFVAWHPRYDFCSGNVATYGAQEEIRRRINYFFPGPDDFKDWLKEHPGTIVLPLYLYDHSVQHVSCQSYVGRAQHAEWDSGQVGYVFVEREKVLQQFGGKRITRKLRDRVIKVLKDEVKDLDRYISGQVYGFIVEDPDGNQVASCWGFFTDPDDDEILSQARGEVDSDIKTQQEKTEREGVESRWYAQQC